jgi:predicted nucleic acid-binding protein
VSRLYLDACTIIYLVEAASPFHDVVAERVLRHRSRARALLLTSRLSRLECRSGPLRDANAKLLSDYDKFFSGKRLVIAELSAEVVEAATALRARYGFRTPDALHLATAIRLEADVFLTGDAALARCRETKVELLER